MNSDDVNLPNDFDACYEEIASQEEIYLEENEEEIRVILTAEVPSAPRHSLSEQRTCAMEDLITGDPDDPPLSEEVIDDMLKTK